MGFSRGEPALPMNDESLGLPTDNAYPEGAAHE
jgi:hypothetical protein